MRTPTPEAFLQPKSILSFFSSFATAGTESTATVCKASVLPSSYVLSLQLAKQTKQAFHSPSSYLSIPSTRIIIGVHDHVQETKLLFIGLIFYFVSVCIIVCMFLMGGGTDMSWHVCEGQTTALWNLPLYEVPRIEYKLPVLCSKYLYLLSHITGLLGC